MNTPTSQSNSLALLPSLPLVSKRLLVLGWVGEEFRAASQAFNPEADYTFTETCVDSARNADARNQCYIDLKLASAKGDDPTNEEAFDCALISNGIEPLIAPREILTRLHGLLADGGSLILSLPNILHWTQLEAFVSGKSPEGTAQASANAGRSLLTLDALSTLLREVGFEVLKIRPINKVGDRSRAEKVIPALADTAQRLGYDRRAFIERANACAYVIVARKVSPGRKTRMLRLHISAMSPRFLDVRARLPADALNSLPDLHVTRAEKTLQLPSYPVDAPKVCVLQRLSIANEPAFKAWVRDRVREGWVLVAESDDHPALMAAVHGRDPEKESWLSVAGVHAVQTSTPALAEAYRLHNPEVVVFPNAVFSLPPFVARSGQLRVFLGALNRERITSQVARSLTGFCKAHPFVEFVVVHDSAFFNALPSERKTFHPAVEYETYLDLLGSCHVALMPLQGTFGETFKSDVKFLEAASRSVIAIASPTVYEDTIVDGKTGLIAREMDDWARHLSALATDQDLRQPLAHNAWQYVKRERMFAAQVAMRRDWYNSLWDRRVQLADAIVERVS